MWYDLYNSEKILLWLGDVKGSEFVKNCGKYTVKDLGVLSYIVKFMDVKSILKRAPVSYADAFDHGKMKVEIGDKRAILKITGGFPPKYSCLAWCGCFQGMLDITRAKGTDKEIKCFTKGDPHCAYEVLWD